MAAIAILGTILVGVVLAMSRHSRQIALTERHSAAVRAADELITAWWTDPNGLPIDKGGVVSFDESLKWQTRLVRNPQIEGLGARVLRVEIREVSPEPWQVKSGDETLIAVDLVLPDPVVEEAEAEERREAHKESLEAEGIDAGKDDGEAESGQPGHRGTRRSGVASPGDVIERGGRRE